MDDIEPRDFFLAETLDFLWLQLKVCAATTSTACSTVCSVCAIP